MKLSKQTIALIEKEIRAGRKIEAIKLLKEAANISLLEAKERIESWEIAVETVNFTEQREVPTAEIPTAHLSSTDIKEIEKLLSAGKKIEAIKIFKEATGLGLKEAKECLDIWGQLSSAQFELNKQHRLLSEQVLRTRILTLFQEGKIEEASKLVKDALNITVKGGLNSVDEFNVGNENLPISPELTPQKQYKEGKIQVKQEPIIYEETSIIGQGKRMLQNIIGLILLILIVLTIKHYLGY